MLLNNHEVILKYLKYLFDVGEIQVEDVYVERTARIYLIGPAATTVMTSLNQDIGGEYFLGCEACHLCKNGKKCVRLVATLLTIFVLVMSV